MENDLYLKQISDNEYAVMMVRFPKDLKLFSGTQQECNDYKITINEFELSTKVNKKTYGEDTNPPSCGVS
jgi:hypothetical protein